jgi:RimJ/RimL family protein N-acetyltransferase
MTGAAVDTTPARLPQGEPMIGRYGRLERLDAARHGDDLWHEIATDAHVWRYFMAGPFSNRAEWDQWLAGFAQGHDPYPYAVIDPKGRALGFLTLLAIKPDMRVIEVGFVTFGRALQRTALSTEAQYLLAEATFALGYRRYEWKCNALNAPSRAAAERLGFTFEGIFRQHMIVKGRNRDTAWYSMLDSEWPARRRDFERWLDPSNFDADGRQRTPLRHDSR